MGKTFSWAVKISLINRLDVSYRKLEVQGKYLGGLKSYLLDRLALEGKYNS